MGIRIIGGPVETVDISYTLVSGSLFGIYVGGDGVAKICYSVIRNNTYGIYVTTGGQATLWFSEIYDNQYGVYINGGNEALCAYRNEIHDNGDGICLVDSDNNEILGNNIHSNTAGIPTSGIHLTSGCDGNIINWNNITENYYYYENGAYNFQNGYGGYGVYKDYGTPVNAEYNWWGDASGPSGYYAPGTGDRVNDYVDYDPWLGLPWPNVYTATGDGPANIYSDDGVVEFLGSTHIDDLPDAGKPDAEFPYGLFSFNIWELTPDDTVTVTITLPGPVPVGTEYWKYQNGQWIQIPMGSDDGDEVITITLTDGGPGDGDGVADGVIRDPGGPAVPVEVPEYEQPEVFAPQEPEFDYLDLNVSPAYSYPNRPIVISLNVVNTGDAPGHTTVSLIVNGKQEDSKIVFLKPGSVERVSFTVKKSSPEIYGFFAADLEGEFQVKQMVITYGEPQSPQTPPGGPAVIQESPDQIGTAGIVAIVIIGILVIVGIGIAYVWSRQS